jgi:hypothetical protein
MCHLEDTGIGERIVLEEKTEMWSTLVGSYEHDNEPPAFIKGSV